MRGTAGDRGAGSKAGEGGSVRVDLGVSDRAKRLIEALHELGTNEARWMVAQVFLEEEAAEAGKAAQEAPRGQGTDES